MIMDPLLFLPGPTYVPHNVRIAQAKPLVGHRTKHFRSIYRETVDLLKDLMYTENDVFILTSSGTGAVEAMIVNIVNEGDKILVPVFGAFSERLCEIIRIFGGTPIPLRYEYGKGPTYEDVKEAIEKNDDLKAIAIVYNDTSPGVTVRDLPKIAEYSKNEGILVLVDAISIFGGDKLLVDEWKIDVLVAASQKCLASPPGLAFISVSNDAWNVIKSTRKRAYYFDLEKYRQFDRKNETPFTPAISLLYALNESIKTIMDIGYSEWIRNHEKRANIIYEELHKMGAEPFVEKDFRSNTIISFAPPKGIKPSYVVDIMASKYNVYLARGMGPLSEKIVRVGNMGYIGIREIRLLIELLSEVMGISKSR